MEHGSTARGAQFLSALDCISIMIAVARQRDYIDRPAAN